MFTLDEIMKITKIQIKNFRSLRSVAIDNLGDLTIIIGENSSGKSNVLEALDLFFNQFDSAPQRNVGAVNDYLWFDRNPQNNIEFTLSLSVTDGELKEILPEQLGKLMTKPRVADVVVTSEGKAALKNVEVKESNDVQITRVLSGTPIAASWSTKLITLNGKELVSDGHLVFKIEEPTPSAVQPPPQPQAAGTAVPPGQAPNPPPPSVSPTDVLGSLLQKFSQKFTGGYRVISAARNVTGPSTRLGDRVAFVNQGTMGDLTTFGQSMERDHLKKWADVERYVTRAAQNIKDLRLVAGQITVGEKGSDTRYPISLVGGGNQEILSLAHELTKGKGTIYGLEEPEQHLHPELARDFFDVLREISKDNQVLVTTHSPVFVDQVELGNTWLARRADNETLLVRVKEDADLKEVLYEIGARPSDIFFANAILFVEGPTERVVIPILAKKLGIDLRKIGLTIIPIHGKGSGKYHLQIWIEAAKAVDIPYFMLLDNDAKSDASRLVSSGLLKDRYNLFILQKGSIEDYYPEQRIIEALRSEFNIDLTDEERRDLLKSPRAKSIKDLLTSKKIESFGWKISIGRTIASRMTADEVDDEIRRFAERLHTETAKVR
jgi:ABC-type lipoprotein export system ATPase subunit